MSYAVSFPLTLDLTYIYSRISLARSCKGRTHCHTQTKSEDPSFFVWQTLILSTHGSNNPRVDYNPSLEPNYRQCN